MLPGSTTGGGSAITMSMDGSAIGFIGRSGGQNQLFVHRLADATTTLLRGTGGAGSPVLSPDGRWVAFGRGGTAWRVGVDGGEPEALCVLRGAPRGGAWGADGRLLFASTAGLNEVTSNGGDCEVSVPIDAAREARFLWPQVLPLERGVLLTVSGVSDDADSASIVAVPAGTTERRVVVRGARAGRVTASGHLVFARGSTVFAAPFDLNQLAITADPVAVVEGVASGQFSGPLLGVSAEGDLVYAPGGSENSQLVWISRNGTREDTGAPRRSYQPDPRLSPDGRRIAVGIGTADHYQWLYEIDTGTLTPLVAGTDAHGLVWSPDGRKVAYQDAGLRLSIKDLESTGEPEAVLSGNFFPWGWSPDGATLLFNRSAPEGGFNLVAFDLRDRSERFLVRSRQLGFGARISPDGRWLAYASDESGRLEVYVTDFPAARLKRPVSVDGGFAPVWASDGKELFHVSGTSMMSAAVVRGDPIAFARPVRLFDGIDFGGSATNYSVAPDGRFLFVEPPAAGAAQRSQLTLVLNWFTELQQRVPLK
jgi:Tol biopolymer transport system component